MFDRFGVTGDRRVEALFYRGLEVDIQQAVQRYRQQGTQRYRDIGGVQATAATGTHGHGARLESQRERKQDAKGEHALVEKIRGGGSHFANDHSAPAVSVSTHSQSFAAFAISFAASGCPASGAKRSRFLPRLKGSQVA